MSLKDKKVCDWEECTNAPGPSHFIHGRAYCPEHYSPALEKHFFEELNRWDRKSEPSQKFRNLFARYIDSFYGKEVSGGLTKAMLEGLNVKDINSVLKRMGEYREREIKNKKNEDFIKTYGRRSRMVRVRKEDWE